MSSKIMDTFLSNINVAILVGIFLIFSFVVVFTTFLSMMSFVVYFHDKDNNKKHDLIFLIVFTISMFISYVILFLSAYGILKHPEFTGLI